MIHYMKLKTMYLNMIEDGLKNIELRLFDEKRKLIEVGDIIEFSDISNPHNTITTQVTSLYNAINFAELCCMINSIDAGFHSDIELIKTMQNFYPLDEQQKYGVVGIRIKRM